MPESRAAVCRYDHTPLRRWRLESGLRPERIAADADISAVYLRKLEDGAPPKPAMRVLVRIAAALGRDVRELFVPVDADEPAA
jgi:transcriptional regulator with XRE-family HTH domain